MKNNIYPLSFSRMQVFEQCAWRFEGQYITGEFKDAGSDASRYGNRVHKAFEDYLKSSTPLPDELEKFAGLLDKFKAMPGWKFFEEHMAVRADKSLCKWDDADCWLRGIADWVVIKGDRAFAGDWKTGKPRDDTFQLMLMACFIFEHYPQVKTVNTKYVWLFHPKAPSPVMVYQRHMLADYWKVFEGKVQRVEEAVEAGVFPATPSGLCPWCPRYETCNYVRRRRK